MKAGSPIALLLALAGCAHWQPGLAPNARYVAMGSSYAAGTGINGIKPGTPQRCGRSASNYATLLANRIGLSLDDQTCGGATTAHVLGPWNELPPQIDAVTADTQLVTVTIGGNDLGYVRTLYMASCPTSASTTAPDLLRPCPAPEGPSAASLAKLETNLRQIAREVRRRAPGARLYFVQYVKLVPDRPCPASQLTPAGALVTRDIGEQLARVTKRAAEAEGAFVISADELSRGHTLCDADPWSVGAKAGGAEAPAPWHPNAAGHAAIARELEKALRR